MKFAEPYRLVRYTMNGAPLLSFFYTSARPGRSLGSKQAKISDEVVHAWVAGITKGMQVPKDGQLNIISLLGQKPTGLSEFSYYSFRGGFERAKDRLGYPTWQEWLTQHYGERYCVYEFPTEDVKPLSEETREAVVGLLRDLIKHGKSVVVVDSGGIGRTGSIVHAIGSR